VKNQIVAGDIDNGGRNGFPPGNHLAGNERAGLGEGRRARQEE
jgi:hypothetical protein